VADWGAEAERPGWPAADLVGLDPVAPLTRYSNMGKSDLSEKSRQKPH